MQFLSTPERAETNPESIMGRYVLPHSSEQPFLGLSPGQALTQAEMTGSNSPVSNTTPQSVGFRTLFQPPSLLLSMELQGVGSITQANAGQKLILFSHGSVEDLKVLAGTA